MKLFAAGIFLLFQFASIGQNTWSRYWVTFRDKDSSFSITQPEKFLSSKALARRSRHGIRVNTTDLPVSINHLHTLQSSGAEIIGSSRWLNAALVEVKDSTIFGNLRRLPGVTSIQLVGQFVAEKARRKKDPEVAGDINEALSRLKQKFKDYEWPEHDTGYYGKSYPQVSMLNCHLLHSAGYTGKGVSVAIIDAGFQDAQEVPCLRGLFQNDQISGTYDFVDGDFVVFDDDDHGLAVLSCMAAHKPAELVGTAPFANYWLFRSEFAPAESLSEECLWVFAAEYADSVGVDLINSSLGYNTFDDTASNHNLADLNGNTTIISKAARFAAEKGIVVLNASGNEGDNEWRYISAPADVKEILTVGGTDQQGHYSSFSSIGPTADRRIKPDIAALAENVWIASPAGTIYQGNGTSYACPVVAGMVACLIQAAPNEPPQKLIDAVKQSSSNYYAANSFTGYGIPDGRLALKILGKDAELPLTRSRLLDARVLADQQMHLVVYSRAPEKMKFTLATLGGTQVYSGKLKVKNSGISRFSLSKTKIKPGSYAMYMYSKDGASSSVVELNR